MSEEEPKDAGHFDPLRHRHRSNIYSFRNQVLTGAFLLRWLSM